MSRAVVMEEFGGTGVLRLSEVEVPAPAAHQVRIAVKFAGVGPTDLEIRAGRLQQAFTTPPGSVLGFEVAGVVESVGSSVRGVSVGDDVAAFLPALGGYGALAVAEYWVAKPSQVSWEEAAALPASGEAAGRVLDELDVGAGETLLVVGASGSVGLVATQLAVARGARVIAAVRDSDRELVESLGAVPVSYGADMRQSVNAVGAKVDAVFDAGVGSDLRAAIELADGPDRVISLSNHEAFALGVRLSGPDPQRVVGSLTVAMNALADRGLRLRSHTVLPLELAGEAHARIEAGERAKFLLQP